MNSLKITAKILGMSLIILIVWGFNPAYPGSPGPERAGEPSTAPGYEGQAAQADTAEARRAALAAAIEVLTTSRFRKGLHRAKEKVQKQYSFEFKKEFPPNPAPGEPAATEPAPSDGLVFSGGLSPDMTPFISFSSSFKPADFAIRFDALDQDLDLEISSRPVNRMSGGKTSLGLSSDGSDSEAVLKFAFEF